MITSIAGHLPASIRKHHEFIALGGAFILLLIAASEPSINVKANVINHLIFIDVTQSMNTLDMTLDHKQVSRLEYTRHLLQDTVSNLPCGSRIGIGVFFKSNITLLFNPIETCSNLNVLHESIGHIEWRMASRGNSNIRLGLQSMADLTINADYPFNVVFMTDGQESPPLNAISKTSLASWQGGKNWLLVGIGGDHPMPIPKLDNRNEIIGYWSIYSIKIAPGAAVNDGTGSARDESLATEPYEYYLSQLDETYMKELAFDIGGNYLRAKQPD